MNVITLLLILFSFYIDLNLSKRKNIECDDDVCNIMCEEVKTENNHFCKNGIIDGSDALDFRLHCNHSMACANSYIKGPFDNLKIICLGKESCANVTISAKNTRNVELFCLGGNKACDTIRLKQRNGETLYIESNSFENMDGGMHYSQIYGPRNGQTLIYGMGPYAFNKTKFELSGSKNVTVVCGHFDSDNSYDDSNACHGSKFKLKKAENVYFKCYKEESCTNLRIQASRAKYLDFEIGWASKAITNSIIQCPTSKPGDDIANKGMVNNDVISCRMHVRGDEPIMENVNIYAKNGFDDLLIRCLSSEGKRYRNDKYCKLGNDIFLHYCNRSFKKKCLIQDIDEPTDRIYECQDYQIEGCQGYRN